MLTDARSRIPWLRDGASVPQHRGVGMPLIKWKKDDPNPSLNYTQRGFSVDSGGAAASGWRDRGAAGVAR